MHPDDEYAMENEHDLGKSECWHILEASPDAKLIMGLSEGITRDEFLEKVYKKEFDGIFNIVSVKKGDTIHLRPGACARYFRGECFNMRTPGEF